MRVSILHFCAAPNSRTLQVLRSSCYISIFEQHFLIPADYGPIAQGVTDLAVSSCEYPSEDTIRWSYWPLRNLRLVHMRKNTAATLY